MDSEENIFDTLNPDVIGQITRLLQPKDVANWKKTGKSMKNRIESTYNLNTNTVNVVKKDDNIYEVKYKSPNLEFDFTISVVYISEDDYTMEEKKEWYKNFIFGKQTLIDFEIIDIKLLNDRNMYVENDKFIINNKSYEDKKLIINDTIHFPLEDDYDYIGTLIKTNDNKINFSIEIFKNNDGIMNIYIPMEIFAWIPALTEITDDI